MKNLRYILPLLACLAAGNAGAITLKFDCIGNYDADDPYCAVVEQQVVQVVKGTPANFTELIFSNLDSIAGNPVIEGIYFDSNLLEPFNNTDPVKSGGFSLTDWTWTGLSPTDPGWILTGAHPGNPDNLPDGGDFESRVTAISSAESFHFDQGNSMTFVVKQNINRIENAIFGNIEGWNFDIGLRVNVDLEGSNPAQYRSLVSMPVVPVPASVWLFGTALIGFIGFSRRRTI